MRDEEDILNCLLASLRNLKSKLILFILSLGMESWLQAKALLLNIPKFPSGPHARCICGQVT